MRSDPSEYLALAPGDLLAVLSMLAAEPGQWLPIAGGTDVMVQYGAGKLASRKLVNIWGLAELQGIEVLPEEIRIGAGCTYTSLREHDVLSLELPLLATAAGWTGGIANQNRGTLGGNIVNASPAADSLPALLAYEAELLLVSVRGERRVPYTSFHTGYKTTQLAPDELVQTICIRRGFQKYLPWTRKVGARNAQAISKVCIAALGRIEAGVLEDVRIALGAVAPVPLRLTELESALRGKPITREGIHRAKEIVTSALQPINDIRSTASYRTAVAGNLVVEFLERLQLPREAGITDALHRWNLLPADAAANEILPCCGSRTWAQKMAQHRPIADEVSLLAASDKIWNGLTETQWEEAFRSHPRIGVAKAPAGASAESAAWSAQEQYKITDANELSKIALAEGNRQYESRFGRTFIVCATGKSPEEILQILKSRLNNDEAIELREAAEQQRQITRIRLGKWLER